MEINELKKMAVQIRKDIINMITEAGSGHPGGSLSSVELMVALYFDKLRHNPNNPNWEDRDRVIFSKGHACPLLYSLLARSGYFSPDKLVTLRKLGSSFQGHPDRLKVPGIDMSSGSLGQGLSVGVGVALGERLDAKDCRIYVLMGDGEMQSGAIWEAAMSAGHYKLDNLCGIIDYNNLQIDGCVEEIMGIKPLADKWRAFRWHVIEIDGHDIKQVLDAYDEASKFKQAPSLIIARTVKGKGVSFMENICDWHGKAPTKEECVKALEELSEE